jgi:rhodanese-related sulfurtransferase
MLLYPWSAIAARAATGDKMVENVPPSQTWDALRQNPQAQLVDVRTDAEWGYVGLPDLREAGKKPLLVSWQNFPGMQVNHAFVDELRAAGLTPAHHIYFLCRTGGRSAAAARAANEAGFPHVFNIADGFEGLPNGDGHRGTVNGWKAENLPWRQG